MRDTLEPATQGHVADSMPSTVIRCFDYDAPKQELLVVFRSGRRYIYEEVPEAIYVAMRQSFSKGEFFNQHIRERFAFRRVDS
jgi:hypothetical protein